MGWDHTRRGSVPVGSGALSARNNSECNFGESVIQTRGKSAKGGNRVLRSRREKKRK